MNESKKNWKNYTIIFLLLVVIVLGGILCKQSGDNYALAGELAKARRELDRNRKHLREIISEQNAISERLGKSANEAISIGEGIGTVSERFESENEDIERGRKLVDDSLRIIRESRTNSEKDARQTE